MEIVVTGSEGQLGTAIKSVSHEHKNKYDWNFLNKADLDITNKQNLMDFFNKSDRTKTVLINCAAFTDVERAEDEPEKAFLINSDGAKYLAECSQEFGFKLIHISTDFVFNGAKQEAYNEDDEPDPVSVYGKSKFSGEKEVMKNKTNCLILRTSWLYSTTHQTFLNKIMNKIQTGTEIKVVDDEIGSPTYSLDLANDIITIVGKIASEKTIISKIYHYCNTGSINRYEYAKEIIKLAKKNVIILPINSQMLKLKAKRPENSSLDNRSIIKDFGLKIRKWDLALKDAVGIINAE